MYFSMWLLLLGVGCRSYPDNIELKKTGENREEVRKYHDDGSLALKGQLKDGVTVGTWEEWYQSGTKKAEYSFLNGLEQGQRTTWYPSGKIAEQGEMLFGKQEGLWKMWYPSGGMRAETSFQKGVETGERVHWFESGSKESQATIRGGLQNGLRTFWYENGQVKAKGFFRADLKQGPEETFSTDGSWVKTTCFDSDLETRVWSEERPVFSAELCFSK